MKYHVILKKPSEDYINKKGGKIKLIQCVKECIEQKTKEKISLKKAFNLVENSPTTLCETNSIDTVHHIQNVFGDLVEVRTLDMDNEYDIHTINVTLKMARNWYNSSIDPLRALALDLFNESKLQNYPNTYEMCKRMTKTKRISEIHSKAKCFAELIICRDVYRRRWTPDWSNILQEKYCIVCKDNKIEIERDCTIQRILSFEKEEQAITFHKTFFNKINDVKDWI